MKQNSQLEEMKRWLRSPDTLALLLSGRADLTHDLASILLGLSVDELVQRYDDAMDLLDDASGESDAVLLVARQNLSAVKMAHDLASAYPSLGERRLRFNLMRRRSLSN